MAYTERIIEKIKQNTADIPVNGIDELRKTFNISLSKFKRDFKSETGTSARGYLIGRKIELAYRFKSEDPGLTIKEVVIKIGWDLSERQFANLFREKYGMTFGGKAIGAVGFLGLMDDNGMSWGQNEIINSRIRKELEEIIFRIILLSKDYTTKDQGQFYKLIISNIENTCFQLPFPMYGKQIIFCVSFDLNNFEELKLITLFSQLGDTEQLLAPNDYIVFLDLIQNVAMQQKKEMKQAILESIVNWDEMLLKDEMLDLAFYQPGSFHRHIIPKVNRNAGIFQQSQSVYDSIVAKFKVEYEDHLNRMQLSEPELSSYISAIERDDETSIKSSLKALCEIGEGEFLPQKLDLLLQLAQCPYMEHIEFDDYTYGMDKALILKIIALCPRHNLPGLIMEFLLAYKIKVEDSDEDNEYEGNKILADTWEGFEVI